MKYEKKYLFAEIISAYQIINLCSKAMSPTRQHQYLTLQNTCNTQYKSYDVTVPKLAIILLEAIGALSLSTNNTQKCTHK